MNTTAINLIICFAFLVGLLGNGYAQRNDPQGKEVYFKYENENVELFRDRIDFKLPEPNVIVKKPEVGNLSPDSLSAFFVDGKTLHIKAADELNEWIRRDSIIKSKKREVQGFRIQVYAGNKRNNAFNVKSGLISRFPDYSTYLEYKAPNYVVRIGDFMDREDAILFQKILRDTYSGAFIVPDVVKVPKYNPDWRRVFDEKKDGDLMDNADGNDRK